VEEHLEGTKERARRRQEAARQSALGDDLAERYREVLESPTEQRETLAELRAEVKPWEPVEAKQDLWDAEDALAVEDALRVRTLQAAVAAYDQAIEAVPNHPGARRALSQLYWSELQRARQQ